MKLFKLLAICALLALLLVPAAVFAQEQAAPEHGVIEFGFRGVTGDVYGRTQPGTLQFSNGFQPDVLNSRLNLYSDNRNSFYVPKFNVQIDNLFGSKNYFRLQSASNGFAFENGGTLSRDQSWLVSVGQYGHFKAQFRYDQTPHIFSGTTRTLFTSGGPGVWNPATSLYSTLCPGGTCTSNVTAISNAVTSVTPNLQSFTQQEYRKTIGGSMSWNLFPDVNVSGSFSREHQLGTRPIGFVMGNGSTGYMVEAPESLDYYTTNFRIATEFGKKNWDGLLGFQGSYFHNGTPSMVVGNPFSNTYSGSAVTSVGPATGRMDLYPDNQYQQILSQGAVEIGKYIHLMASITPGFLRQNQTFQPLSTNTSSAITTAPPANYPAYLPSSSLNGQVDTLTMNYTAVFAPRKDFKIVTKYFHYTYDNNTPDMLVRPVIADTAFMSSFHGGAGAWFDPVNTDACNAAVAANTSLANCRFYLPTEYSSFTNRLFDVSGTYFFTKNKSVKFGYQRGWTDRTNREVAESTEDSIYGALDMRLHKTLSLRVSGRHQNRVPQEYEFADGDYYVRMVDQAPRVRNRGDVSLQWDPTDRLSISPFFGTLQDNYNQRGGVNSTLPLGDASISPIFAGAPITAPTPIYGPYYAYGVLNSIGRNYGVDVNYALTPKVTLFAEFAREKNTGVAIEGRAFDPTVDGGCTRTSCGLSRPTALTPVPYSNSLTSTDPINDLLNASKDVTNSYYGGIDFTSKKLDLSLYYGLSAGQSFLFADGVNCQVGSNGPNPSCGKSFANWKLDYQATGTPQYTYYAYGVPGAGGFGFPETVSRVHEVGAIVRFKLTDRLMPKFQYIFQQNDFNDWQTQVNPYSFMGTPYSYAGVATDPMGQTALQKMLWLGADNPSYRAHIFSATLEYHF